MNSFLQHCTQPIGFGGGGGQGREPACGVRAVLPPRQLDVQRGVVAPPLLLALAGEELPVGQLHPRLVAPAPGARERVGQGHAPTAQKVLGGRFRT